MNEANLHHQTLPNYVNGIQKGKWRWELKYYLFSEDDIICQ